MILATLLTLDAIPHTKPHTAQDCHWRKFLPRRNNQKLKTNPTGVRQGTIVPHYDTAGAPASKRGTLFKKGVGHLTLKGTGYPKGVGLEKRENLTPLTTINDRIVQNSTNYLNLPVIPVLCPTPRIFGRRTSFFLRVKLRSIQR